MSSNKHPWQPNQVLNLGFSLWDEQFVLSTALNVKVKRLQAHLQRSDPTSRTRPGLTKLPGPGPGPGSQISEYRVRGRGRGRVPIFLRYRGRGRGRVLITQSTGAGAGPGLT